MIKKVLFIISQLKTGGGAERVTSELSINLTKKYENSVVTFLDYKNIYPINGKYYSFRENLKTSSRYAKFFKINAIIPRIVKIYKIVRSVSPDIVISFLDYTNIFTIITKFLFRIRTPLIICVHTNPKLMFKRNFLVLKLLIKLLYSLKAVNKIITVSNDGKNILNQYYRITNSKIKTIYNGIDLDKIKVLSRETILEYKDIFANKNIIKFITMGRLSEEKGHKYLIEAYFNVRKEIPNSKLFLIGEGPLKDELNTLIDKKNLQEDVILLGFKKNPFKYLYNSDIFVLSSLSEGLPMALIEALSCGLPIISTNCKTGPEEILDYGKAGILIGVKDIQELENKMILLAENEELKKKYSERSLKRAEIFAIKKIILEWIKIIENHCS